MKTIFPRWLAPILAVIVGGGACFISLVILPESYHEHHEWPAVAALAGCIFFFAGIADLFLSVIPAARRAQALFFLGLLVMLGSLVAGRSIAGILIGGFVALIGFGGIALQK